MDKSAYIDFVYGVMPPNASGGICDFAHEEISRCGAQNSIP